MGTKSLTSAVYLQSLLLIHVAMLMGMVLFAGVVLYLGATGGTVTIPLASAMPMLYVVAGVTLLCVPMSVIISRRLIATASEKPTFAGKLRGYQIASLIRGALLEAPALMATAAVLVTGLNGFLIVPAVAIALLVVTAPTKTRVASDLHLGEDDQRRLNDPAFVLG